MINLKGSDLIKEFQCLIESGLPGVVAHKRNAPYGRLDNGYDSNPVGARQSAVLILLYYDEDVLKTVLFKRTDDGGVHSGQVSFPGGKVEKSDASLIDTALREAYEEVGVKPDSVSVIGELTPLYIPVSNFSVQPILAYSQSKPNFSINTSEVEELILPSLYSLFARENRYSRVFTKGETSFDAICLAANGHEVWGATAIILAELEALCNILKLL